MTFCSLVENTCMAASLQARGHAIILLLAPIMMFVLTVYSYCLLCFDKVHQFRIVNVYLRNGRGTARPGTRETPASLMA